jgi:electron transfer flavoprotein beta subunit
MKVLVPIKRVVSPHVKIRVQSDDKGVDTQHAQMCINPFDEIALEEAVRWKEKQWVEDIIAVSLGDNAVQESLRAALGLGATRAIHLFCASRLEPLAIAKCLKSIVLSEGVDLVIMGKQAIDDDCNQTGQMLAGLLSWGQATFASNIVFSEDKKSVEVTREVDSGTEILSVTLPCVITTDLRLNEPRNPSLPQIMQAKRKPLETRPIDSTIDIQPRCEILHITPPPARKSGIIVKDIPELMHYLRHVEKVI